MPARELPFAIVYELGKLGTWSLAGDTLQHSIVEVAMTNVTQPEDMDEERTVELCERLVRMLEIDQSHSTLLGLSSARVLTLSVERLDLLDEGSRDVAICRPAETDPSQAR